MVAATPGLEGVVQDVRGLGLMWLVQLDRDAAPLHRLYRALGAYVPFRERCLFVCPPLCLTAEEAGEVGDLRRR